MCSGRACGHDCILYNKITGCMISVIDAYPDMMDRLEKLMIWAEEHRNFSSDNKITKRYDKITLSRLGDRMCDERTTCIDCPFIVSGTSNEVSSCKMTEFRKSNAYLDDVTNVLTEYDDSHKEACN